MKITATALAGTFAFVTLVATVRAAVTFSDSEFNDADWELLVLTHEAGGDTTAVRSESGGCPDAHRIITTMVGTANRGTQSGVIGFHRRIGATYAPAKEGAFEYIDYSECAAVYETVFADGQATGPALRQDGKVYFYYLSTGPSGAWYTKSATNIWATNFFLVSSVNATQWYDPKQHPDFSTNGGPIEFGFWRGNFTCPGCPGYTVSAGIDQWSLALQSAVVAEIRCSEVGCSEVEVCWNANPNRRYTVEYRSDQTAHQWKELVGPVTTNCVRDAVGPDEQRLYRVIQIP